ncbi:hypothetical protein LMK08_25320 [Metapseudomonas furukawaii]|uniref:hypothetical protein n=1 Tax=Metapseudomonas furukawaii TaxID=1149133 RepID=UPI00227D3371|nr:hypothetical protein [Pseudomonas furukawaii]WAG78630.1 hypothetical protein LMK08_25320 [Pseudomonas furukawaii]
MQGLIERARRVRPAYWAFAGSLLLSWIAVHFEATIAKDAALYLDAARVFNEQGFGATLAKFNWPWFSILIGVSQQLTGLSLESLGYLLCAMMMAGTCALMVDAVASRTPGGGAWACLLVLAMPAYNTFRGDILREYGFWFFSTLALWLALRWHARGGWLGGLLIAVVVATAAVFRLEAVMLMAALFLWLVPGLVAAQGRLRMLQLVLAPSLALLALLAILYANERLPLGRFEYYLALLDPRRLFANFNNATHQLGAILAKYSSDDASAILLFGFFATTVLTFVKLLGPFSVPFFFRDCRRAVREHMAQYAPFAWAWVLYFGVLMVFFVQQLFINSRYASFLNLLAVPLLAPALMALARRFPRAIKGFVVVAVLVMMANVISLSAKKTHYVEAGHWLATNAQRTEQIYQDDPRIAYYAGWGYIAPDKSREAAMSDKHVGSYRYFLLEEKAEDPNVQEWLQRHQLKILAQFANRKRATVLVIGR